MSLRFSTSSFVFVLIQVVAGLVTQAFNIILSIQPPMNYFMIFLSQIFGVQINLFKYLIENFGEFSRRIEAVSPLITPLKEEDEIKRMCEQLRDDPNCAEVKAVWCTHYPDIAEYFEKEKETLKRNEKLVILRLINPTLIGEKEREWYFKFYESLDENLKKRYSIKISTSMEAFECFLVTYMIGSKHLWKAVLIVNDVGRNIPSLGILLDPSRKTELASAVTAIETWFKKEWDIGKDIKPYQKINNK
jgi:hypothetical protein